MAVDDFVEFVIVTVGAIIGSAVIIGFTYWYDDRQEKRKKDYLYKQSKRLLLTEFQLNIERINESNTGSLDHSPVAYRSLENIYLYHSIFDSLVSSGNLLLFPYEEQQGIQEVYTMIRKNNEYVPLYTRIIIDVQQDHMERTLNNIRRLHRVVQDRLRTHIVQVKQQLEIVIQLVKFTVKLVVNYS